MYVLFRRFLCGHFASRSCEPFVQIACLFNDCLALTLVGLCLYSLIMHFFVVALSLLCSFTLRCRSLNLSFICLQSVLTLFASPCHSFSSVVPLSVFLICMSSGFFCFFVVALFFFLIFFYLGAVILPLFNVGFNVFYSFSIPSFAYYFTILSSYVFSLFSSFVLLCSCLVPFIRFAATLCKFSIFVIVSLTSQLST